MVKLGIVVAFALLIVATAQMTVAADLDAAVPVSPVAANLDEWPQFRGPNADGHAPQTGLPVSWGEKKNVAWKTAVPGRGWSSPVVHDGKIWLTTSSDQNRSLRVLSFDCDTGKPLDNVEVFRKDDPGKIHDKNSHATPSLIVDGDFIFAHFGAHGTACLSTNGNVVWKSQTDYYHHHGPGGSPLIFEDLLIYSCDGYDRPFYDKLLRSDVPDNQFVVALDKRNGDIRWKTARAGRHSYSTPLLIDVNGEAQIVSPGGDRVVAYNPETGNERWSCRYEGYSVIPRPVYALGLVFVCTGFDEPTLLAIRPDGQGDVTESHIAWRLEQGVPLTPSPLVVGDELYLINDGGIATCLEATSGKRIWRQRIAGKFSASPVFADGRIYMQSENGVTHVMAPGRRFNRLATNRLPGETLATMAVAGHAFYVRTEHALYRIEDLHEAEPAGKPMTEKKQSSAGKSKAGSKPKADEDRDADDEP